MKPSIEVSVALRNNAAWCDAVCRTHGSPGVFARDAWTTSRRSPELYPDAITLQPTATADTVLARIDTSAGCSVKDSFATLDLAPGGFRVLFAAEWIGLGARAHSGDQGPTSWRPVRAPLELEEWVVAWTAPGAASPFRPELLDEPGVTILAGRDGAHVVAGAVLNRAAGAVGLTNLFTNDGDRDAAWSAAVSTARALFPSDAIVGYEAGDDLDAARRAGFTTLGPLRVWMKDEE